jgi:hypothetical protein
MTRNDAQMIFDWFVRQYGLPLEGAATTTFVSRDDNQRGHGDTKHDADRRMRRHEHRNQDDGND